MYSVIETQKGKPCLLFNGYRYLKDRTRNNNVYWRCENRSNCSGRATQEDNSAPILTAPHSHEPDEKRNACEEFRTKLKRRIRDEPLSVRKLFRSKLISAQTTNPSGVSILPQFLEIKNSLYDTKNETYPRLPKLIDDVKIEGMLYLGSFL
ncbi:unnamed protein product [Didymodactylos carnosus]|uniref:FLYWCH-type domain-containing protein n=1 Tax=Didymodactylos carnosus TaxID=1234261 RepID=A0A814VY36_9BILA|nr:unnamed protein product [Didymodactylos carnosus]CAF1196678.1 unnamed protein product [Didymodactylos carnosus]CAF3788572.1 unnamed protein product [Didymodactylos carnosus]CAF3961062.1 unnamed protein product [Didymodactylos carnosus]